jgi:signal transduction histidine kinase
LNTRHDPAAASAEPVRVGALRERWRISTFRLTILFGVVFTIGNVALLGLIYWQTTGYLERRIDRSIEVILSGFQLDQPETLLAQVRDALVFDLRRTNIYGLFTPDKKYVVGNVPVFPPQLTLEKRGVQQFPIRPFPQYRPGGLTAQEVKGLARVVVRRAANGYIFVVGREATQLAEIKTIMLDALLISGTVIIALGLITGFLLSVRPLRRINAIRATSRRIVHGELSLRMPVSSRHDELDMLATIVNLMLEEIERLLTEVKSVTDTLAHDLRTPLTRVRLLLYRAQQQLTPDHPEHGMLDQALGETDMLLSRFRALLRISEIENQQRKAGFAEIDPRPMIEQIGDLFDALAEDKGVTLLVDCAPAPLIHADAGLLFEAVSNLVDNAIKFTPAGGTVQLRLSQEGDAARIDVIDSGRGIPVDERGTVLQRFYRGRQNPAEKEGYGLGLSIVAAILRLHDFTLVFQDSPVGTHLTVLCPT